MRDTSGHVVSMPAELSSQEVASADETLAADGTLAANKTLADETLAPLAALDQESLPEDELSRLMIRYQQGELAAFDELYARLQPALRRYLFTLTLNATQAEDLLQETFLQLHRSRHTFSAHRPARAWAFGIARHVFLMDRRAATRRQRREQEQALGFEDQVSPKISAQFAARDRLQRAISILGPDQREPLLLHHVWGFSFEEIGGLLGIRSGTAKVRAHRALHRLRHVLEDQNHG